VRLETIQEHQTRALHIYLMQQLETCFKPLTIQLQKAVISLENPYQLMATTYLLVQL